MLLADDSDVICEAIRAVLSLEPRIEVVGETTTIAQTIEAAHTLYPNVILLDLHMPPGDPDFNYLTAKPRLHACCERVVAMSLSTDEETNALATLYGAVPLLDKASLALDLIPALLSSSGSVSVLQGSSRAARK